MAAEEVLITDTDLTHCKAVATWKTLQNSSWRKETHAAENT